MKIVTDSAADLPRWEIEQMGIRVAPLQINYPEGEISSEEISPDEFYTRLIKMEPDSPSTSQPSPGIFAKIYADYAPCNEEILSIHISGGLSGTLEAARLGAQHHPHLDITFVDSLTLSGGQRFQVLAAALGAKVGWSKQAILERLKQIQEATEVVYTLDTLNYLARGGRIGRVQAIAGALLKIKPIISVDKKDGKYNLIGRGRTIRQAMETIVSHITEKYGTSRPLWISVMHGQYQEKAEVLGQLIHERVTVAKSEILRISPVLGVHTGPGVVGLAVVPFDLMEGLG